MDDRVPVGSNTMSPRYAFADGRDGAPLIRIGDTARFTCDAGDFVLIRHTRRVQAMVAAAGLPPQCAPSVDGFLRLSCASAANSFHKAVAVTVEAGDPGSIAAAGDELEGEDLPPGECAICYEEYLVGVGDAAAVRLPACGHAFHRGCIDRWTDVNRSCPCCRARVPWSGELRCRLGTSCQALT